MWGGSHLVNLSTTEYNNLFRFYKSGTIQKLRRDFIAEHSSNSYPRPWAIYKSLTDQNQKLRTSDCALLLKWTRDVLSHQIHRERRLETLQLGVAMFDQMLHKHIVGEAALCQLFALCEITGDLKTAMDRYKTVLDMVADGSDPNMKALAKALREPVVYCWLLRVAYSAAAMDQGFDTVATEQAIRSIVEITVPEKILLSTKGLENFYLSSSATSSSSSSPVIGMETNDEEILNRKTQKKRSFGIISHNSSNSSSHRKNQQQRTNNNMQIDQIQHQKYLSALIAPHDATLMNPSETRPTHSTIPFTIAALLHVLRPLAIKTDEGLQRVVDSIIDPAFDAQQKLLLNNNNNNHMILPDDDVNLDASVQLSPSHHHSRFLKSSLMSRLVAVSGEDSKSAQITASLLRRIMLFQRRFNFSSMELTDGPRGSSGVLWLGGSDNPDNAQPPFDSAEILSSNLSSSTNHRHQSSSSNSYFSSSENHYTTITSPQQQTNPFHHLSLASQWSNFSTNHLPPLPLSNSILSEGQTQEIIDTIRSLEFANSESKNDNLSKLVLLLSKIPQSLLRRLHLDGLRNADTSGGNNSLPILRSDSHEMLSGGCGSDRDPPAERRIGDLIMTALTTSSSTPELMHYLICALANQSSPGLALESIYRMLVQQGEKILQHTQTGETFLFLLPLDPTINFLCACLIRGLTSSQLHKTARNDTLELAASLLAHSTLVRNRRLASYRDSVENDDANVLMKAVWMKRHFDHVFETNMMSELQSLLYIGNAVATEDLEVFVELFRRSSQMVEETMKMLVAKQNEISALHLEKRRKELEEKDEQSDELEKSSENNIVDIDENSIQLDIEAQHLLFLSSQSPIVRTLEKIKSKQQQEEESIEHRKSANDENLLENASVDSLILNYPTFRQALQMLLLKTCATSADLQSRNIALEFAPKFCPLLDLAAIGSFTGFTRYFPKRKQSWNQLSDVVESFESHWRNKNRVVILDASFVEASPAFLRGMLPSSSELHLLLVPHCVLQSLDATATCGEELAPINSEALVAVKDIRRNALNTLTQITTAVNNGTVDVIQFSEQLLAAALTRQPATTESTKMLLSKDEREFLESSSLGQGMLSEREEESELFRLHDQKTKLAEIAMVETEIGLEKTSALRIFNDTNSILIDVARMLFLATLRQQNRNKIVIATNDISLIDRVAEINKKEGFSIGTICSVPIEVLRNPDLISDIESQQEKESILSILEESVNREEFLMSIPERKAVSKEENATMIIEQQKVVEKEFKTGLWQQVLEDENDDESQQEQSEMMQQDSFENQNELENIDPSVPDTWQSTSTRQERLPNFPTRPDTAAFAVEFTGHPRFADRPLKNALAGELDRPEVQQHGGDNNNNNNKTFRRSALQLRLDIEALKHKRVTPFRSGMELEDEAFLYRPSTRDVAAFTATQLSKRSKMTVPVNMRYRKWQANVNDPRNAELVDTYKAEKEFADRRSVTQSEMYGKSRKRE